MVFLDLVVVAAAALVVPASLGRDRGRWAAVAASLAVAFSLEPGPAAAVLAAPWVVVAVATLGRELHTTWRSTRPLTSDLVSTLGRLAVPAWAGVAGIAVLASCGGWDWFGVGEPITRLTAAHFSFAGCATTALALAARREAGGRTRRVASATVLVVIAAPPLVGLGFLSHAAAAQVGGAVVMTLGVYLLSALHLAEGWRRRRSTVGRLLLVSGASTWAPMALAVAWALAQHTGGPALSIPDLIRTHGAANAIGFVGCALAARHLQQGREVVVGAPVDLEARRPATGSIEQVRTNR